MLLFKPPSAMKTPSSSPHYRRYTTALGIGVERTLASTSGG